MRCERPGNREEPKSCETEPRLFFPHLPVFSQESVLQVPKRGQFHAAIRVTLKHCDSCAQGGPGTQRALRGRLMSRGKNCLPTVSRQFLTRNYPRPNCLLKCLPNCLSHKRGLFILFQNQPRGEGNCETSERQKLSRGNFCPATSICLFWPTGERDGIAAKLLQCRIASEALLRNMPPSVATNDNPPGGVLGPSGPKLETELK